MTDNEKIEHLKEWVFPVSQLPDVNRGELGEALYSFSECGMFPMDVEVDVATALEIWAIIETVREIGFPNDLRM